MRRPSRKQWPVAKLREEIQPWKAKAMESPGPYLPVRVAASSTSQDGGPGDDPVGDACQHEGDDDGDCTKCLAPGGPRSEVEVPTSKLFAVLLEHLRQAVKLTDKIHNDTGRKHGRHYEYTLTGIDSAWQETKKWRKSCQ